MYIIKGRLGRSGRGKSIKRAASIKTYRALLARSPPPDSPLRPRLPGKPSPCLADIVLDLPTSAKRATLDKHSCRRLTENWVAYAFCFLPFVRLSSRLLIGFGISYVILFMKVNFDFPLDIFIIFHEYCVNRIFRLNVLKKLGATKFFVYLFRRLYSFVDRALLIPLKGWSTVLFLYFTRN